MGTKYFTSEEMTTLKASMYVKNITQKQVSFTIAFKQRFWEEYQTGKMVHCIIADMGIDPEILGDRRIYGIRATVKNTVNRGESFRDKRSSRNKEDDEKEKIGSPIAYMQHRINYLEQEMEFIKKIIITDKEAEQRCLSKAIPKSSSKSYEE